jgi:HK97 gp10 family phage protein
MNFAADVSELAGLAQSMAGAAVQSDINLAHAIDAVAPKVLEEQQATVPVRTGALRASLGIERNAPADARIGAVLRDPAGWRAHFTENGTATQAPRPFIRPAGDKYAAEFARTILLGPMWRR